MVLLLQYVVAVDGACSIGWHIMDTRLVHCLLHLHQCRYKYEKLQECYRGVLVVNIMSDDPCVPNNEHSLGVRPRGIKVVGQDLLLQVAFTNIGDERGCHGNVHITGFERCFLRCTTSSSFSSLAVGVL